MQPLVKQNVMKLEIFYLRRTKKRKKGWWRGKKERIEKRDKRELSYQFEEEDKEPRHLPLLVVQLTSRHCISPSYQLDSGVIKEL